jgi:thiol-disulfide isomerase/thioredoxin
MKMRTTLRAAVLNGAMLIPAMGALAVAGGLAHAADIKREGEGTRRQSLNALELKPFKFESLASISQWNSGSAPTTADLNGKVIVLLLWSDWYAPCKRVVAQCNRLAEKFGKDGVVVIAAHGPQGWDAAKNLKFNKDIPVYAGFDEKGEFRKAVLSDQDPDVYVIDRAGQMRYADVDKGSLEAGVTALLKEEAKDAASINDVTAKKAKDDEAAQRRAQAINVATDMTNLPEIEFTPPSAEEYKAVAWPKMPVPRQPTESFTEPKAEEKKKLEEKWEPFTISDSAFITPTPSLKGRLRLVYFWHPDSKFSFEQMVMFDLVQRQLGRDVVVIGAIAPVKDADSSDETKVEMDPAKLKKTWDDYVSKKSPGHSHMIDGQGSLYDLARAKDQNQDQNIVYIPYVALVGSDGVMRWGGFYYMPSFRAALSKMLEIDPGVKARRAAEAEFIRKTKK